MTEMLDQAATDAHAVGKVAAARGSACPGPLLEATKSIGGVPVGGVLEVLTTDPQTKSDMTAWCNKVGHGFIGVAQADGYERVFVERAR
jgi:TusA-related sulfurtransferase